MKKQIKQYLSKFDFKAKEELDDLKKRVSLSKTSPKNPNYYQQALIFKLICSILVIILIIFLVFPQLSYSSDAKVEHNPVFDYNGNFILDEEKIMTIKYNTTYLSDEQKNSFVNYFNSLSFSYIIPSDELVTGKSVYFELHLRNNKGWIGINFYLNDIIKINNNGIINYFFVPSSYQSVINYL